MISRANNYNICFILGALFFISGCAPMYVDRVCPSYITRYEHLTGIHLGRLPHPEAVNYFEILPKIDRAKGCDLNSVGEQKEKFEKLCQKHGDVNYNQVRSLPEFGFTELITFYDKDFAVMNVVSDSDFDDAHPAGTSLADIVRFLGWSPHKYIQSGYSMSYHYMSEDLSEAFNRLLLLFGGKEQLVASNNSICHPIDKKISELEAKDMILLRDFSSMSLGILYFEKTPENIKEHTITLKMTTDDGDVFENSIKIVF